jgi:ABC-2 type transport system permease protein
MAMFLGIKGFGIQMGASVVSMGDSLEGFIVGYFLWTIMVMAYSDIAYSIINDSSRGTLEQLNMSSISLARILTTRSFSNLLINYLVSIILLFVIMASTGYWLQIKIFSILVPIFIGIFSILGIGLICGGLALIFKKVQSLLSIIQYFLIGLVTINIHSEFVSSILPFRPAAEKVFMTILGGCSLSDFSPLDYGIMIGNSILYFSIGLFVFNQCVKFAKTKGLLGQY